MFHKRSLKRLSVAVASLLSSVVLGLSSSVPPAAAAPTPVSATPLPTAQVNGVVWATAAYGNTIYATGRFSQARPAGVRVGGAGSVTRYGLMAFNATTGAIIPSFVHHLGGYAHDPCWGSKATGAQGCALAVSPDGKRLYIGGAFSTVDGQAHSNIAAIDLTTNKVVPGFRGTNLPVKAIAATNSMVYVGGNFTSAGGYGRSRVAAYNANGSLNTRWAANTNGIVRALVTVNDRLVIGGQFNRINGAVYYSLGAVYLSNGRVVTPWASQSSSFPIRMPYASSSITGLSTDGTQVYLTAYTYIPNRPHPGTFEGRAAIRATNGSIVWINDCIGDSYGVFAMNGVLYSASHAHSCAAIGGFRETNPKTYHRGLAETTTATGKNIRSNGAYYPSFVGWAAGSLYNWYPNFSTGTVTGINQGPWSVTGNGNYVVFGGEFLYINGKPQQGLVRFGGSR